jgi:hypothetical protein
VSAPGARVVWISRSVKQMLVGRPVVPVVVVRNRLVAWLHAFLVAVTRFYYPDEPAPPA